MTGRCPCARGYHPRSPLSLRTARSARCRNWLTDGRRQSSRQRTNARNNGGSLGWISDESGFRVSAVNVKPMPKTHLPTCLFLTAAASVGCDVTESVYPRRTPVTVSLRGCGEKRRWVVPSAAGFAGMWRVWVKSRYGQTFDAVMCRRGRKSRYQPSDPGGIMNRRDAG